MVALTRANLERAGIADLSPKQVDARNVKPPTDATGILLANPPYGERIEVRGRGPRGEIRDTPRSRREETTTHSRRAQPDPADTEFFVSFGNALKQRLPGWRAYVLTSNRKLPGLLRLRESTKTPLSMARSNAACSLRSDRGQRAQSSRRRMNRAAVRAAFKTSMRRRRG